VRRALSGLSGQRLCPPLLGAGSGPARSSEVPLLTSTHMRAVGAETEPGGARPTLCSVRTGGGGGGDGGRSRKKIRGDFSAGIERQMLVQAGPTREGVVSTGVGRVVRMLANTPAGSPPRSVYVDATGPAGRALVSHIEKDRRTACAKAVSTQYARRSRHRRVAR